MPSESLDDRAASNAGEASNKLNSVDLTAARLSISSKEVRRLAMRRELRAVRIGRRVLFSDTEIARFIADREKSA